jgi:hypothetical protein
MDFYQKMLTFAARRQLLSAQAEKKNPAVEQAQQDHFGMDPTTSPEQQLGQPPQQGPGAPQPTRDSEGKELQRLKRENRMLKQQLQQKQRGKRDPPKHLEYKETASYVPHKKEVKEASPEKPKLKPRSPIISPSSIEDLPPVVSGAESLKEPPVTPTRTPEDRTPTDSVSAGLSTASTMSEHEPMDESTTTSKSYSVEAVDKADHGYRAWLAEEHAAGRLPTKRHSKKRLNSYKASKFDFWKKSKHKKLRRKRRIKKRIRKQD